MPKNDFDDIVFRYSLSSLETNSDNGCLYDDKLVELFRLEIINILDLVELTYNGKRIKVDGYTFISDPDTVYSLFSPD